MDGNATAFQQVAEAVNAEMAKQQALFVEGALKNGVSKDQAIYIFELVDKFAGYGFNKSHAAAYAIVAYQTAYLKANHPVEFLCAMMTNDQADLAKLAQYIAEARGFGIDVLGPDVNESDVAFAPARRADGTTVIRFGLAAIKGVGEIAVKALLESRRAGRFQSLSELCERVDGRAMNRKTLECLVKAGACDGIGPNRATLWAQVEPSIGRAASIAADRARGQASFLDALEPAPSKGRNASGADKAEAAVDLPEWPAAEKLAHEKELLGFYVSGHPLEPHQKLLQRYALQTIEDLASLPNRSMARVGGLVSTVQQGVSKKSGKPYAMVTVEDLTGAVTLLAMNESYDKFRDLFVPNTAVLVVGEVSSGEDKPKIFPTDILRLEEAPRRLTKQVQLQLDHAHLAQDRLQAVRDILEAHAGRVPFFLRVRVPSGAFVFIEPNDRYAVAPSVELEKALVAVCGPDSFLVSAERSLPERAQRRWEKRSDSGGDDGG